MTLHRKQPGARSPTEASVVDSHGRAGALCCLRGLGVFLCRTLDLKLADCQSVIC